MKLGSFYTFNLSPECNTANFRYFKQVFSEMNRASNGKKFIKIDDFNNLVAKTEVNNTTNLAILSTQYHIMNYDVADASNGGLTYNKNTHKFSLTTGKMPFYMLDNTVIPPTSDYLTGTNAVFNISDDLYFKNGTKTIEKLVADFGIYFY